jgi:hypothetical protein
MMFLLGMNFGVWLAVFTVAGGWRVGERRSRG